MLHSKERAKVGLRAGRSPPGWFSRSHSYNHKKEGDQLLEKVLQPPLKEWIPVLKVPIQRELPVDPKHGWFHVGFKYPSSVRQSCGVSCHSAMTYRGRKKGRVQETWTDNRKSEARSLPVSRWDMHRRHPVQIPADQEHPDLQSM